MLKRHALLLAALALFAVAAAVRGPLDDAAVAGRLSLGTGSRSTRPDEIFVTRMTGGFRALFINALWMRAIVAEQNYQYYELSTLYERISMLQPRYPEVWSDIVHNMAFQLTSDRETPEENWEWIQKAIEQGEKGAAFNPDDAAIPEKIAYVYSGKIVQNAVARTGDQAHLEQTYRRFLREQKGQTYHERTVYWLNRAFRARDGNYSPQTLTRLWYWYTILHYKAKGAGDTERAEEYLRLRKEVVAGSEKFQRLHERMTRSYLYDAGMARTQVLRMTGGDLASDEPTDAARWTWIRGGLVLAKEFLTRYDASSASRKGDPYTYALLRLEVGSSYVRVWQDPLYEERYRKEFSLRPPVREATAHYAAARKALWAARREAHGQPPEKLNRRRNREIDVRIVATAYSLWVLDGNPRKRKMLEKEVEGLVKDVKRMDPDFYEAFLKIVNDRKKEAREAVGHSRSRI